MTPELKLFVQGYCSCGTSAYIPIKTQNINSQSVHNAMREGGWRKLVYRINGEPNEVWQCRKCDERNRAATDAVNL